MKWNPGPMTSKLCVHGQIIYSLWVAVSWSLMEIIVLPKQESNGGNT